MSGLAGIVGMAGVVTIGFMFLSARAITIWSTPRLGPKWVAFFASLDPFEEARAVPRRSAVLLGVLALVFELGITYAALHPELLPPGGSLIFAIQVALAVVWTVYFLRLPRRR
jgi:hypothetical protein